MILLGVMSAERCSAFTPSVSPTAQRTLSLSMTSMDVEDSQSQHSQSRRGWMTTVVTSAVTTSTVILSNPSITHATVYVDPDRYGDKELKIATVNKLRQNIRNTIVTTPTLAPLFVKLAILDAISYNPTTGDGGPDGTIVSLIMAKDAPASVAGLKPAAEKLLEVAKGIKRTTEITMADVVTFAGAEAIESAGGPRIVVQLGKTDPKQQKASSSIVVYPDLCGKDNGAQVIKAFLDAGLSEREVALLYGAIGSMEKVADSVVVEDVEEEEANEMGDVEVFIPSSFGAPSQIYGKQLGAMDNSVYTSVVSDMKKGRKPISDVFTDEKVVQWATKYAGSKGGFLKDLPEAYGKMMALGTRYTGGKVGSLLGQSDSDL